MEKIVLKIYKMNKEQLLDKMKIEILKPFI
jgi:hypothetical protein